MNPEYIKNNDLRIAKVSDNYYLENLFGDMEWERLYKLLNLDEKILDTERVKNEGVGSIIQICSRCGHNQDVSLNSVIFVCEKCGLRINRNLNIALYIK